MVPVIGETIVYKSGMTRYEIKEIKEGSIIVSISTTDKWTQIPKDYWSSYMLLEEAQEKYPERFL